VNDYDALYAEKCRLQLDLRHREQQLADARRETQSVAERAEKHRAHLQHRIDALVRKVREQHALLNPPVEFVADYHGVWSRQCNGGPGCIGWVGHGEHSQETARRAWDEHVQREHKETSR
jgi:hypothetical protein